MPLYVFVDIVLDFHFWHDRILVSFPTPNNVQSDIILHSGAQYTHIINNMRFSVPPHVIIILFVISAGRCFLIAATPDHSVPEQQEDRILQDTPLENDVDPCSSSCDSSATSDIAASLDIQVEEQDGEEENSDGIFGGLLGRLMNGFFKMFKRRQEDGPKYTVRTESIVPLLEESSTKFKSLADLIMQESATDATPDAIRMLYNASAENMLLVATVLDPILDNLRSHPTMEIRSISCDLMTVLTLLRDSTVPNIKLAAKILYTKLGDAETKDTISQYIDTSQIATTTLFSASTTASSGKDGTCIYSQFNSATARLSAEEASIQGFLNFIFDDTGDAGPIQNIIDIIILIILYPLSLVISIVGISLRILPSLFLSLLSTNQEGCVDDDRSYGIFILLALVVYAVVIPIGVLLTILQNINELLIINPQFPTPSPIPTATSAVKQANEVMRRILVVLDSPIKTIVKVLENKNSLSETTEEEEGQMDCEMSMLQCNAEVLNDILPF